MPAERERTKAKCVNNIHQLPARFSSARFSSARFRRSSAARFGDARVLTAAPSHVATGDFDQRGGGLDLMFNRDTIKDYYREPTRHRET